MKYPTLEQVEAADRVQLCQWWRFLPSPGTHAIGTPQFKDALSHEAKVMERIDERLKALGGFTPQISKKIGWER